MMVLRQNCASMVSNFPNTMNSIFCKDWAIKPVWLARVRFYLSPSSPMVNPPKAPKIELDPSKTILPLASKNNYPTKFGSQRVWKERNTLSSRLRMWISQVAKKLIVYPEDQAWVRSEDLEIAVRGQSNSIEWFVNGERTKLNKDSVKLEEEGFHKITANIGECEETVSVFVEVTGGP